MSVAAGEWGGFGRAGSMDRAWQERLAAFLVERGISDNFFWCLNPNSGDTVRTMELRQYLVWARTLPVIGIGSWNAHPWLSHFQHVCASKVPGRH